MAEPDGPSVSLNGVVVALVVRRNQIDLCAINSAVAPPCSVTEKTFAGCPTITKRNAPFVGPACATAGAMAAKVIC